MRAKTPFLSLSFLLLTSTPAVTQRANPLVGTWEMSATQDAKGNITQTLNVAVLLIISPDGRYTQTEIPTGRKLIDKALDEMTKEELLDRFQRLVTRFGTYRIAGSTLVRRDVAHSDPNEDGSEQAQTFRIEGDMLILTNPIPGDKTEVRFRRMKAFTDPPADPAKVAWLRKKQVPLRTIDPTDVNLEDLKPLKQAIGNSRLVMLGEQSHGDGATFDAKTRMIRYLHEQMGFNVLAFESGLYDCELGNTLLLQGKPVPDVLNSSIFGIWARGEKMVPLFDYLAATTKSAHPLVLTGFDIQFSSAKKQTLPSEFVETLMARLAAIDGALASEDTRTLLTRLSPPLSSASYGPTKDEHESSRRQLTVLLDKVTAAVGPRPSRDNDFTLHLVRNFAALEQAYSTIPQDSNPQSWDGPNIRDGRMAENLVWLLDNRYRGEKVIVWAASMHIARDVAAIDTQQEGLNYAAYHTMGQGAWDVLKDQMYSIAFTAYDGVSGSPGNARALPPAAATSLEGMLHASAAPLSFIDFRSLPADHWLRKPVLSRPLGYSNMLAAWPRHFDAMVFTETMYPNPRRADLK